MKIPFVQSSVTHSNQPPANIFQKSYYLYHVITHCTTPAVKSLTFFGGVPRNLVYNYFIYLIYYKKW